MKKLTALLLAALILSGCQKTPTANSNQNPGVFTTIKDAIAKQLIVKCNYTDTTNNNQVTTTYIQGTTVRLQGTGTQANVDGLIKDNIFYLWDNTKKQGMKIDLSGMATDGSLKMNGKPIKSVDDIVAALEAEQNNCGLSPQSAGLFTLPSDVTFTDASNYLK